MMEAEPEYGDAQLMTLNPHARAGCWDDYSRLHNEDLARQRERAHVTALKEEQRRRNCQMLGGRVGGNSKL